ncbi:hypothetical protein [Bacillus sp. JJ1773]|uniref:hypothetical protein n=1 Tax=Bacillus sp. JJ1773 TaxID=3122965 RepID=UPI0030005678
MNYLLACFGKLERLGKTCKVVVFEMEVLLIKERYFVEYTEQKSRLAEKLMNCMVAQSIIDL